VSDVSEVFIASIISVMRVPKQKVCLDVATGWTRQSLGFNTREGERMWVRIDTACD
jgi:hypothetical protein